MKAIIDAFRGNKEALIAFVVFIAGIVGWKYFDYKQDEVKTENIYDFARNVANDAQRNIILATANPKLKLEYLQFNDSDQKIYGDTIYKKAEEIREDKNDTTADTVVGYFVVKFLIKVIALANKELSNNGK